MGIFNPGGMIGAYSTLGVVSKPSIWDKIGKEVSSFEKEYKQYPPQNTTAKSTGVTYKTAQIKKNNMLLYIGGGGLALLIVYLIMK